MKNKNGIYLSLFFLTMLMAVSLASASVTVNEPSASAILSGATLSALNATGVNLTNCTFYAKSASTANSSWSILGTFENDSLNIVNGTFNSSGVLQDSNDYIFNATCRNTSNSIHDGTRTGITIDNTIPVAPTLTSPASSTVISSTTTQTFASTVTDARTTGCTYTIYRGGGTSDGTSDSGTYATTSCSFTKTFTNSADNGVYYWTTIATDGTNTTTSTSNILNVQIPGGNGGVTPQIINQANGTNNLMILLGIIGLGFVVYYIFKK